MKNRVILTICIVTALFAACRSELKQANSSEHARSRQVVDDLGRSVNLPAKITRVVSLAPNLTENIFAVGAGDRLVGVTTFCNYPDEAKSIAKIGDTMTPNMESIVALRPDVVFVSTASQIETFMKTLEANGIAVYVTNPTSLDGVLKNLTQLGVLFGTENLANTLVTDLQRRVTLAKPPAALQVIHPHPRVFVQISREPLFTIGKQSFLTDLIAMAGGQSVTAEIETAYPKLSKETAARMDPLIIILSKSDDNLEPNDIFKHSVAVKTGRVYSIDADILSRPGPRLVDALEQISNAIGLKADHR